MIFPILSGILSFQKAPVTWLLTLLTVALHLITQNIEDVQPMLDSPTWSEPLLLSNAQGFCNFVLANKSESEPVEQRICESNKTNESLGWVLLQHAISNKSYLKDADRYLASIDLVERETLLHRYRVQDFATSSRPSSWLGLHSANRESWLPWWTYAFQHASMGHLVANTSFLVIFGMATEAIMGSILFSVGYIWLAIMAALSYSLMSGISSVPLVGASGAISGLMGFFLFMSWGKNVRFFYWLLPAKGYFGLVMLPAWVAFVVWFAGDVAGFLSSDTSLNNVAHGAHLGGLMSGLLFGFLFKSVKRDRSSASIT
ncbi:MAG: hypothetical protein COT74_12350 [Bdellovibrionales bacterium CG10_big_fil_rev_8_21_14_0_10_45_34]|nr:MAG: hypothetical protein COT74_12350 [Bdellovibrionales bacterium CG10_big_fil_rev_8_21_14_0_10_45_34]